MVKKVGLKKSSVKKLTRKNNSKKVSNKTKVQKNMGKSKYLSPRNVRVLIKNLILFTILFVTSFMLYEVTSSPVLGNFFWLIALITGFVDLAFVIIGAIFLILKYLNK